MPAPDQDGASPTMSQCQGPGHGLRVLGVRASNGVTNEHQHLRILLDQGFKQLAQHIDNCMSKQEQFILGLGNPMIATRRSVDVLSHMASTGASNAASDFAVGEIDVEGLDFAQRFSKAHQSLRALTRTDLEVDWNLGTTRKSNPAASSSPGLSSLRPSRANTSDATSGIKDRFSSRSIQKNPSIKSFFSASMLSFGHLSSGHTGNTGNTGRSSGQSRGFIQRVSQGVAGMLRRLNLPPNLNSAEQDSIVEGDEDSYHSDENRPGVSAYPSSMVPTTSFNEKTGFGRKARLSTFSEDDETRKNTARNVAIRHTIKSKMSREAKLNSRTSAQRCSDTAGFSMFFAVLIVVNALFVGAEVEWMARQTGEDPPLFFEVMTHVFAFIFLIELIIRVMADGADFFCRSKDMFWNYLDIILVLSSLIEFGITIAQLFTGSGADARGMQVMRIARIMRLARVVRVVRFVQALGSLVQSIMSTLKSLAWAMLLLLVIMYAFGTVFTQAATLHLETEHNSDIEDYWSTIPRSMFSLFKAVSGGINWHDFIDSLGNLSPAYVGLFLCFVTFVYFAVLNVVTGVFCHSAIDSASHDYESVIHSVLKSRASYAAKVKQLFQIMDSAGSGVLTISEFESHLEDEKFKAFFAYLELEASDAWTLFKLFDIEQSHALSIEAFLLGALRLKGTAKAIDLAKTSYEIRHLGRKLNNFMALVEESLLLISTQLDVPGQASRIPMLGQRRTTEGEHVDSVAVSCSVSLSGQSGSEMPKESKEYMDSIRLSSSISKRASGPSPSRLDDRSDALGKRFGPATPPLTPAPDAVTSEQEAFH